MSAHPEQVRDHLRKLQLEMCSALAEADGEGTFFEDLVETEMGGMSAPNVLEDGRHIERAGINFTHSIGTKLPAAATVNRPALVGRGFQAVS